MEDLPNIPNIITKQDTFFANYGIMCPFEGNISTAEEQYVIYQGVYTVSAGSPSIQRLIHYRKDSITGYDMLPCTVNLVENERNILFV